MSTNKFKEFFSMFNLENARDFVDKYITQIIYSICILALVVFIAIFLISRKNGKEAQLMVQYYQATNYIKENKVDEAMNTLKKVYNSKDASENTKTLSGIRLAELLNLKGQEDQATEIYEKIYNLKNNDLFLKNLSGLAGLTILINQNNANNYSKIELLIQKLSNPKNPLLSLVNEQEGMFEIQRGNKDKGLKILNDLLKQNIDEDSRNRIELIVGLYK